MTRVEAFEDSSFNNDKKKIPNEVTRVNYVFLISRAIIMIITIIMSPLEF